MRCIIAGSRSATLPEVLDAVFYWERTPEISVVLSGGAPGADSHGESWARSVGIPVERHPADWRRYGPSAGPRRNREMARAADTLLAVWDGKSPGTRNMIDEAHRAGLIVRVYTIGGDDR